MRLVVVLVSIAAVTSLLYVVLSAWLARRARRGGPWRADTVARPDGTLAVVVVRNGQHARSVRELPAELDPVELQSELRLAGDEAQAIADELNRAAERRARESRS